MTHAKMCMSSSLKTQTLGVTEKETPFQHLCLLLQRELGPLPEKRHCLLHKATILGTTSVVRKIIYNLLFPPTDLSSSL